MQETHKFKVELFRKLSEDDVDEFGDDLDAVVAVCAQVNVVFLFKKTNFVTRSFLGVV